MMLLKVLEISWQLIMVMVTMVLFGIESMETTKVGRIKDKSDFTSTQKHTIVQEMADREMSLTPTFIKVGKIRVKIRYTIFKSN